MSNMSYCRFRNTYTDLLDCEEAMDELDDADDISVDEEAARRSLIRACVRIASAYGHELEES